jgi:hypothetical protein
MVMKRRKRVINWGWGLSRIDACHCCCCGGCHWYCGNRRHTFSNNGSESKGADRQREGGRERERERERNVIE